MVIVLEEQSSLYTEKIKRSNCRTKNRKI